MSSEEKEIKLKVFDKTAAPKIYSNLLKVEDIQDVESVSANTEYSLLNTSRSGSETPSISKSKKAPCRECLKSCCTCCSITTGLILTTIGILFLIWSPFYILMEERLTMLPGLPPYEWWKTPRDELILRVYIFNVTNAERFLDGSDAKLHMEEIAPIVYLVGLRHINVVHNDNDTLSYTSVRSIKFVPELNKIDLNSTIIVPNYALLGIVSHLHDATFITKFGFNILLKGIKSPVIIKTTIYNFLWNQTDPILGIAKQFAPDMVPSENSGILDTIYNREFNDSATVFIGKKNGHKKFFLLDNFKGSPYLTGHGETCHEKLLYATEGALYPQYLTTNMTLRYWTKALCRVIPLIFEKEQYMEEYKVTAFKYIIPGSTFDRKQDLSKDCHKGNPTLLSGLSDLSKCLNGINMAASFPHYLYGDKRLQNMVIGLKPNKTRHESYAFIEPLTGVPIISIARSQSNIIIKDTTGFNSDLQKFHNISIPMFWLEYEQMGLPYYVKYMMNFTVNLCPKYQYYVISVILFLGITILVINTKRIFKKYNENKKNNYKKNTKLHFVKPIFLKQ